MEKLFTLAQNDSNISEFIDIFNELMTSFVYKQNMLLMDNVAHFIINTNDSAPNIIAWVKNQNISSENGGMVFVVG